MSNQPENSFARPGKIAIGNSFIGRQAEIKALQARALPHDKDAAGNVAIVGLRSFGKTSLVYQAVMLQKQQLLARRFLPIWINVALYETSKDFFSALVSLCHDELLALHWATPELSEVEEKVNSATEEAAAGRYIQRYFRLLYETNIHALFILDEFDHARNIFVDVEHWTVLRDLSYEPPKRVTFIALSSLPIAYIENVNFMAEDQKRKKESVSSFYPTVEEIPLQQFSERDTSTYLQRLMLNGVAVTPEMATRISFYCGGHPYLLAMLGSALVEMAQSTQSINVDLAARGLRSFYVQYTDTLVKFLRERNLLGKLLQILVGPVIEIAQEEIDQLLRQEIIKENPHWRPGVNQAYIAFTDYFQQCLQPLIWKVDLVPWLSEAEQTVRQCITTQLQKHFTARWLDELERTMPKLCRISREREQQLAAIRGSYETGERLNFLNISELFEIITSDAYWECFQPIFQSKSSNKDQSHWSERAAFIAVLRVPLLYRSAHDIASAGLLEIRMFCSAVLELIQEYENKKTLDVIASLRSISHLDFTVDCLEQNLQQLHDVELALPTDLEKQHIVQLRYILQEIIALCQQTVFEHIERLCQGIIAQCEKLALEIHMLETTPVTQAFSTILATISEKANQYLEYTYTHAAPLLTLQVLKDEHYYLQNGKQIEVQLALENADGCGPAKDIRLEVKSTVDLQVAYAQHPPRALSGGKQAYIVMLITLTKQANSIEELPLTISVAYSTRSSEKSLKESFTLRLTRSFAEIANPYSRYVNAGAVDDPRMFWGRNALLNELVEELSEAKGRGIIIYGQKRSGKTSVLYHLGKRLKRNPDLLVLNIGSIGQYIYGSSYTHMKTALLWNILEEFRYTLEDRAEENAQDSLHLPFPTRKEELDLHPELFREVFAQFQRSASRSQAWKNVRIVILLDEFTYLYTLLVDGHPIEDFMRMWKALLEKNYFSSVMVGQDVFPKFRERCANEFKSITEKRMGYIDHKSAWGLIDVPIHIGGSDGETRYRGTAIDAIIELTAGNPFYIQRFCDLLIRHLHSKQTTQITAIDVTAVKNTLLWGDDALSWEDFDNLTNAGDNAPDAIADSDARAVLQTIAVQGGSAACPRAKIECQTQAAIDLILEDLKTRGVITYSKEHGYDIRVKLFKEWLIANER
jgi:hypothetical protein